MFKGKLPEHLGDPTGGCRGAASEGGGTGGFGGEWTLARPGIDGNVLD